MNLKNLLFQKKLLMAECVNFKILALIIFFLFSENIVIKAATITATSMADLQTKINTANSGDIINLANGHYTNNTINISNSGITVQAATPGGVYLDGTDIITISGNNNIFGGFQFTSATTMTGSTITVNGNYNTVTQVNFNGYSADHLVYISGQYNVVSFSNFQNKLCVLTSKGGTGDMVQIIPNATNPGYNTIRYCSFQHMPGLGGDFGNECIRIGDGTYSLMISRTVVEYCYFEDTGLGDSEAISVKSRENTLRYNTMNNNPDAMFSFRNGDNNVAYGNFFVASGGIRCKESNNIYCYNNYFQAAGTNQSSGLPGGGTAPVILEYFGTGYGNNFNFIHNTFYSCIASIIQTPLTNCTWANNIFYNSSPTVFSGTTSGQNFSGNIYQGTLGLTISSGMTNTDPKLALNTDGYYGLSATSPAINQASSNYPAMLNIPGIDTLQTDIQGQPRPLTRTLKDVGCEEYNATGTELNKPLTISNVGPSFLGGPATPTLTNQNILFYSLPTKTAGDVDFAPGAYSTSGLTVSCSSSNASVATIVNNQIHIVGAGTSTITASQVGNTTYNAATSVSQILTVNKLSQSITFATLATKFTTDADFSPGAVASSGLSVTYTSSNTAVATIVSNQIHIVGAGTSNITASQAGNSTYNAASDVVQILTVTTPAKLNQNITFNALTKKTTLDSDFDPGASSSSGLTVTYSSSNTSVATVVNGLVHIIAGGVTTITASQSGNTGYNAAPDVPQSLSVDAVTNTSISLTPTADSYVYGGAINANYGPLSDLYLKKGSSTAGDRLIYMQFDISGQNIYSVSSAKVRLYANTAPSAITVTASQTADNWTETGITYANSPGKGTDISSVSVTAAGAYYEWDVTSYVQSRFSTNDNLISFVFSDLTADGVIDHFNSKEATSNKPQLYITMNKVLTQVTASTPASTLSLSTSSDVTVASGGLLTVDVPTSVNSINVASGGKVTLNAGQTLTAGTFTLQSDATGTGTFVDNGGTLNATTTNVNQYLTSGRNWYMSSPVTGTTTSAINAITGSSIVSYDEVHGTSAPWVTESYTLTPGKGYIVVSPVNLNPTITFSGTLNTGTQPISLTRTSGQTKEGFNLVGNPYPSYINWDSATKTNVGLTIWYRTENTSGTYVFDTYNSGVGTNNNQSGAVTGLIPPMQAYWVRVNSGSTTGSISLDNSMRSHATTSTTALKSKSTVDSNQQLLRLQVSNGINSDEAIVVFNPNASNGFDDYDAPKISNDDATIPELYTFAGTEQVAINALNSVTPNQEIPLGFTTGQSNTFTIKATQVSKFDANANIILRDNLLNIEQDITNGNGYSFTSDTTNTASRFSVIFKSSSITTELNRGLTEQNVSVYSNAGNQITVNRNADLGQEGIITVCNLIGQKLISAPTKGVSTTLNKKFYPGVYLVTINIMNKSITKKLIINE